MKVTNTKIRRPKSRVFAILIIMILCSQIIQAKSSSKSKKKSSSKSKKKVKACIVDKCAVCESKKTITCGACMPGWYLRTFTSGEKTYNSCWSISKLILALLGLLLLSLLLCGICGICYTLGKKAFQRMPMSYPEMPQEHYSPNRYITKPPVYVQEPMYEVQQAPEPVYELQPTPRRIMRAPAYTSPMSSSRVLQPVQSSQIIRTPQRLVSQLPATAGRSNGVIIRPGNYVR